jgi:hypothetical protein
LKGKDFRHASMPGTDAKIELEICVHGSAATNIDEATKPTVISRGLEEAEKKPMVFNSAEEATAAETARGSSVTFILVFPGFSRMLSI